MAEEKELFGVGFLNIPKSTQEEHEDKVAKIFEFLRENKIRLSLLVGEKGDKQEKYVGFVAKKKDQFVFYVQDDYQGSKKSSFKGTNKTTKKKDDGFPL